MRFIFLLFSCILFLNACTDKEEYVPIDVSNTSNIATSPQWAVIVEPYAAYRVRSFDTSDINAHGRIGDIIEVIGSTINTLGKTKQLWYQFENGWLPESSIGVHSNKLKAEFVANQLK